MKTIQAGKKLQSHLDTLMDAAQKFQRASCPVALTGAGISVPSGIADFRSPGGVWTIFSPEEYATIEVFIKKPEKAWQLYRELGQCLLGKKPNQAHQVLADFEKSGFLQGIITQNVDNLHQAAGSKNVLEIHGDHQHLQCLQCDNLIPVTPDHYSMDGIPTCDHCQVPLKPNVVLFGEGVRNMKRIEELVARCDLLLVIGTSAQIYPAAALPAFVKNGGGLIYEFNKQPALAAQGYGGNSSISDYFFSGDLSVTLPLFNRAVFDKI